MTGQTPPLTPEELEAFEAEAAKIPEIAPEPEPILTAYWVSRDGNQGQQQSGTEDLTDQLDRDGLLRVTPEFWAAWQESVRKAEASMNLGLVIMPTAGDVLLPSRY